MSAERRGPTFGNSLTTWGGRGGMTKTSISLQDLRKRIYAEAKADKHKRFWGLYVHVCKMETIRSAYDMAKRNDGAPGIDGVTFEAIEESGLEEFLLDIQGELLSVTYLPMRNRKKGFPTAHVQVRDLGIPALQ